MTKAEQFCKLNRIEWHEVDRNKSTSEFTACTCGLTYFNYIEDFKNHVKINPTFPDAKSILEVMRQRNWEDYADFIYKVGKQGIEADMINIYYILYPDKLLDEAIKFCEENKA